MRTAKVSGSGLPRLSAELATHLSNDYRCRTTALLKVMMFTMCVTDIKIWSKLKVVVNCL